jgi:hypothetical protein
MSRSGRPRGEFLSAKREGKTIVPARRLKVESLRGTHEGGTIGQAGRVRSQSFSHSEKVAQ